MLAYIQIRGLLWTMNIVKVTAYIATQKIQYQPTADKLLLNNYQRNCNILAHIFVILLSIYAPESIIFT